MTPAAMTPQARAAFAALSGAARREFTAWLRNKLQIMTGSNDLEARLPQQVRAYARQRNRAAEACLEELAEIFGEHGEEIQCEEKQRHLTVPRGIRMHRCQNCSKIYVCQRCMKAMARSTANSDASIGKDNHRFRCDDCQEKS